MIDLNKVIVDLQTGELSEEELFEMYDAGYLNNDEMEYIDMTLCCIGEVTLNPHTQKIVDQQKKNWENSMLNPKNKDKSYAIQRQLPEYINKNQDNINRGLKYAETTLQNPRFSQEQKNKMHNNLLNYDTKAINKLNDIEDQMVKMGYRAKANEYLPLLQKGVNVGKDYLDPFVKLAQAKEMVKKQRAEEAAQAKAQENANKYAQK